MKKYKLIKEYPGSGALGRIIQIADDYTNNNYQSCLYKEYWEEVIEKTYQITGLTDGKKIFNIIKDGKEDMLWCKEGTWTGLYSLGKPYTIYSVKRLSDGEVFTIGDEIDYKIDPVNNWIKITFFELHGGFIYVNSHMWAEQALKYNRSIENLVKYKEPVFTIDDTPVYKGDKYYYVVKGIMPWSWTVQERIADDKDGTLCPLGEKQFLVKEDAQEYILYNYPGLSIKDIDGIFDMGSLEHKLVASIIKNKLIINYGNC